MAYNYKGKQTNTFQKLQGFKNIAAWQSASDLGFLVNQLVSGFGAGHYRLVDQMRGAALSVSGNIAEGYCSGSLPNYVRYCNTARGSLGELGSYIQDCERWGLLSGVELDTMLESYSNTTFLLDRLLQSLIKKKQDGSWDNDYWIREEPAVYAVIQDDQESSE